MPAEHVHSQNPSPSSYYLSSILYMNPDSWVIWINGQKIESGQDAPFDIIKVDQDCLHICKDGDLTKVVHLKPNQRYHAKEHRIMDGKAG